MPRTKIVQASAKKTCFQFAERRQSFAKIAFLNDTSKSMRLDFRFRRVSVCQRAIRLCEAYIFDPLPIEDSLWFLHIGKGQTLREMTFAMRGNAKPFGKRLSPCAEMSNHVFLLIFSVSMCSKPSFYSIVLVFNEWSNDISLCIWIRYGGVIIPI